METLAFNRKVTVRQSYPYKAAGRDRSKFSGQNQLDNAVSGQAEAVGEGINIGEALIHLDPALIWEILEQLEQTN